MRVGIPHALLYYQYYPALKTFFETLGAETVVSPATTQTMLSSGSSRVVADTCLPVKAFLGHVLWLADKCDFLFIPAVRSVKKKAYNCSKFLALPDMTRAVIPEAPPILELEIDVNKPKRFLYQAIYGLGRHFSWNPLKIRRAAWAAWEAHLGYQELMTRESLTPVQAISRLDGKELKDGVQKMVSPEARIALIGHPYLIYDEYINHRLINKLHQAGVRTLMPERLGAETLEAADVSLTGRAYWTYEAEVVGAGGYYLQHEADGVIGVIAFGCGPGSIMMDIVRQQANKSKTPFMSLTLDEHTAATGIATRLEAFLDMIKRREKGQKQCA